MLVCICLRVGLGIAVLTGGGVYELVSEYLRMGKVVGRGWQLCASCLRFSSEIAMKLLPWKANACIDIGFDGAFVVHCVNRVAREGC